MKELTPPTLLATTMAHIFSLLSGRAKFQNTPERVGKYTLVRHIQKKYHAGNFGVGIYRHNDTLVFIKSLKDGKRTSRYVLLLNEYFVNSWLQPKLQASSFRTVVSAPRIIEVLHTNERLSVVFEYIDGVTLDNVPIQEREQHVRNILLALSEVSSTLTERERRSLPKRGTIFHLISTLFAATVALLRLPRHFEEIIWAMMRSIGAFTYIQWNELTLAHRELSESNILVQKGKAYLIDSGAMSLTLPEYDRACIATNWSFADVRSIFSSGDSSNEKMFVEIYILMHSILFSATHLPQFLPQYLQELSDVTALRGIEAYDVAPTSG